MFVNGDWRLSSLDLQIIPSLAANAFLFRYWNGMFYKLRNHTSAGRSVLSGTGRTHVVNGVLNVHTACLHESGGIARDGPGGTNEHRHICCVLVNAGVESVAVGI